MAKDLFGNEANVGGAWKIDGAVLNISGGDDLVAVGCSITYQRSITNYSPINQDKRYMVAGPGQGLITIDSIVGPKGAIKEFIDKYSDICNVTGEDNTITIKPVGLHSCDTEDDQPVEFIASNNVLQSLALSISNAGNLTVVTTQLQIQTLNLQVKYL
jgi:hypothetical protein